MINEHAFDIVYETLKEYLKNYSVYDPIVKTTPSGSEYPLVVVEEVDNFIKDRTAYGNESTSMMCIEVNVYADKKTVSNTKSVAGRTIAREIRNHVETVLGDFFGMVRVSSRPTPNIDTTLYRYTMRYNGIVGNRDYVKGEH